MVANRCCKTALLYIGTMPPKKWLYSNLEPVQPHHESKFTWTRAYSLKSLTDSSLEQESRIHVSHNSVAEQKLPKKLQCGKVSRLL